ncbi:oligosaccharide flippase family protein [Niallia sp.]|uniref:oligosaccharide flippase family protein n=1 Tax=Niallia sp. TaxID=2837523 RepID=UPI00289F1709|nr:oligosaccharide flippase family protein [Niallia sp.]
MHNKLLFNTVIYSIGNFLSKIIAFVMLPLYTFYLSTAEFGKFDMYNSIVALAVPLISFLLSESALRFLIDEDDSDNIRKIITTSLSGLLINLTLLIITISIFCIFINDNKIGLEISLWTLLTIVNILFIYLQNVARGIDKSKYYAISGILYSIGIAIFNVLLLVVFKTGYIGLLISSIFAYVVGIVYLIIANNVLKYFEARLIDYNILKKLILYSLPLIPNYLSWWLINMSDRLLISYLMGDSFNGVYAIAYRFSNILFFAVGVFNLAWQESAIVTYKNKDRNEYYSTVFDNYLSILLNITLILIPLFPLIFLFLSSEYYEALYLIPILLYSVVFSALSSFYGTAFQSSKKTMGALSSSILAGLINIALNIALIPILGLMGASIATLVSFFVMFVYRVYQTRIYFIIKYNYKKIMQLIVLNLIQLTVFYNTTNVLVILISFLFVYENRVILKKLLLNKNKFSEMKGE